MPSLRVVSADSHMMEPPDLWTLALEKKYGDRTPQVKKTSKGFLFVAPGVRPFAVAGGFGAGRSGKELKEHLTHGYEAARPGGWDPVERIKDQEIDGVEAEVLYTTLGMPLFGWTIPNCSATASRCTTTGSRSSARTAPNVCTRLR